MAQPNAPKPDPPVDPVDDADEASFPASDAPSFTPVTGSKPEAIAADQVRKAQRDGDEDKPGGADDEE